MPSIKVLAIDGGGIRGIIPAMILAEIQTRLGMDLFKAFDLITGTSTGGIIALGIGTGCKDSGPYSPRELLCRNILPTPWNLRSSNSSATQNLDPPSLRS